MPEMLLSKERAPCTSLSSERQCSSKFFRLWVRTMPCQTSSVTKYESPGFSAHWRTWACTSSDELPQSFKHKAQNMALHVSRQQRSAAQPLKASKTIEHLG